MHRLAWKGTQAVECVTFDHSPRLDSPPFTVLVGVAERCNIFYCRNHAQRPSAARAYSRAVNRPARESGLFLPSPA